MSATRQRQIDGRRKRPKREVGNDEFVAFARRIMRALGRRISGGDIETLIELDSLMAEIDVLKGQAARALVADGYSWADVGRVLGISKQAAHQRYLHGPMHLEPEIIAARRHRSPGRPKAGERAS